MGCDTKTVTQAFSVLNKAIVRYQGAAVGTVAALETGSHTINYD
jgi:hypothetical protein